MRRDERSPILNRLYLSIGLFIGLFAVSTTALYVLGRMHRDVADWPLLDCAYMIAITLSTIGYGEVVDVTKVAAGRPLIMVVIAAGLGIAVYFSASLTTFLVEGEFHNLRARRRMRRMLDALKDHVIVCGAGASGARAVEELIATRTPFVAIDTDSERLARLQMYSRASVPIVNGDAMQDEVLREAGIEHARGLIGALHDDRDNLFLVVSARQLNPRLRIISKGEDVASVEKLRRVGADSVVTPATIGGLRMVSEMIRPQTVQFLDVMMRDKDQNMRIQDLVIDESSPMIGKELRAPSLQTAGNFLVLAIRDESRQMVHYAPASNHIVASGMHLVVLASNDTHNRLRCLAEGRPLPAAVTGA